MLKFSCDVPKCKQPAAFEVVRTAHVVEFADRDADALTETVHACSNAHLAQLVPAALAERFTDDGKQKRGSKPRRAS